MCVQLQGGLHDGLRKKAWLMRDTSKICGWDGDPHLVVCAEAGCYLWSVTSLTCSFGMLGFLDDRQPEGESKVIVSSWTSGTTLEHEVKFICPRQHWCHDLQIELNGCE